MKFLSKLLITLILINFFSNSFAQNTAKGKTVAKATSAVKAKNPVVSNSVSLKSGLDSISYALGLNIAENLKNQKVTVNPDVMAAAFKDLYANKPTAMKSEACGPFIQSYFQKESAKAGSVNKKNGEAFLAKNKTNAGVVVLPSGLQYKIITAGTGAKPVSTDQVKVHYHGTLIDGKVFDSSVNRGEPATFGVTQVIQGWVEALQF